MSTITPILYFDGLLRLTRHGIGKGETVLLHVPTNAQLEVLDDRTAELVAAIENTTAKTPDAAFNAIAWLFSAPVRIIDGKAFRYNASGNLLLEPDPSDPFEKAAIGKDAALAHRVRTEGRIARFLIDRALAQGFTVSIVNGSFTDSDGELVVDKSRNRDEIVAALFSTDGDTIVIRYVNGIRLGAVSLVYGNDGYDVISDYASADLDTFEKWMEPVMGYAQKLEDEAR